MRIVVLPRSDFSRYQSVGKTNRFLTKYEFCQYHTRFYSSSPPHCCVMIHIRINGEYYNDAICQILRTIMMLTLKTYRVKNCANSAET